LAPLRTPAFGRLFAAYTVNGVGDYVGVVALAVLVYAETHDALATTGLFIATQFLPAFAAPALTARVDRIAIRRTLPLIYLGEAAMFGGLAVLATSFSLAPVLVLAFLDGALMLTARALTRAGVNTALQPSGLLREGNGLMNIGFAAASIGGAALGGLIVDLASPAAALGADALSFALVAILLAVSRQLPTAETQPGQTLERLREGLGFARRNATARVLLLGESVALVLFTISVPIEVIYARETLRTNDAGFGLLLSTWGAGIVLGSLLFLGVKHRSTAGRILLSTLAIGIAYLGMAMVDQLWLACMFSVLGGLGNGIQWVSVMTALQEVTPEGLQARVVGLLESVASIMTGVGFLIGGVITALTSPPTAFAVAGGGGVLLVLLAVLVGFADYMPAPAVEAATSDGMPLAPPGSPHADPDPAESAHT
jgi:MFS family permease